MTGESSNSLIYSSFLSLRAKPSLSDIYAPSAASESIAEQIRFFSRSVRASAPSDDIQRQTKDKAGEVGRKVSAEIGKGKEAANDLAEETAKQVPSRPGASPSEPSESMLGVIESMFG